MIIVLLALLVGLTLGFVVTLAVTTRSAVVTSRRTLDQLQAIVDGLEAAYRVEVAALDARRDLDGLPRLAEDGELPRGPVSTVKACRRSRSGYGQVDRPGRGAGMSSEPAAHDPQDGPARKRNRATPKEIGWTSPM